jgi:hypothetical protein
MTPFAQWYVAAWVLILLGVVSVNFWLILAGFVICCLGVAYYGWKIINF